MILFEQSWEVCNKVGGIYTVISTKAKYIKEKYKDKYFLIGPYKNNSEFIELDSPDYIKEINYQLDGIKVHYGYWNIESKPNVFLIEFDEFFNKERNLWKYKYWEWYKIDSLNSDFTFDEPLLWSVAVGIFLEKLDKYFNEKKILHAHEWLSGGTILYIKKNNLNYKTILTIHGTVIGRTLSEKNVNVENAFDIIDPDKDSYRLGVNSKYQLEKQAILNSDIFTVVSDNLGEEAYKIYKRKPDYITYNYINVKEKELFNYYKISKKWIDEILTWYFYPYYDLPEKYLLIYTIGRYEPYNKGLDLFIDLLKYLDEKKLSTVAFIFVPYNIKGQNNDIIRSYKEYIKLKESIEENIHLIIRSLYNGKNILDKLDRIKNKNPPICTHDVENNIIIEKLRENNLNNDKNNYVKVIYVPVYLGNDILFSLDPEYILPAFDFGIFLSRYEPYGYTPLEALNNFVPIVLSNKTGFYRNLISKNINHEYIINVDPNNLDKEIIYNKFLQYYNLDLYGKMEIKKQIYEISKKFDWKNNINEYTNIYDSM
ncbi:Glycosyltransferase [Candidatus Nanobsidianus stetteri]|uniref:Glycosyltransferase n=1 Tax=Nanobsidianus stetteri TaxID=1294122 RepID=R1FSZ7_NANST|nr:Glycosyltransferase [Candidatus Nanobsidianus stetteri]